MYKLVLGSTVLLAFLLRFVGISSLPVGFTPDEASFGYDAYSLLKTGKDQWGESWPLTFRSFGDFKLPVYTYLTIPSVAVFGLNEFAVRLPNALIGTLAILATYLLVRELFKKDGQQIAMLAALLLAISPWHIPLSRGAFEANLTTLFLPLGILFFLKGIEKPGYMFAATIAFGINMFTYHSARILTPVVVLLLFLLFKDRIGSVNKFITTHKWPVLLFAFVLFVVANLMLGDAASRGRDVAIYNPTDRWLTVVERRYEATLDGLPDFISRLFSNKITYTLDQFISSYLAYFSPQFLFTSGAGEWTYGMIPGRGVLYLIELAFLIFAFVTFSKERDVKKGMLFLLLWVLVSPLPASLAKGPGNAANRVAVMVPALQIISAIGMYYIIKFAKVSKLSFSKPNFILFLLFFLLVFFLEDYIFHFPARGAEAMLFGRREAVEYVKSIADNYQKIIFSRSLSEPHIYVAFFNAWDPADYQVQAQDWLRYKKEGRSFVDQLGLYKLGKYEFSDVNFALRKTEGGTLLVGKPSEFPENTPTLKTVYYVSGKPAILIVDPNKELYAHQN